MSAARRAPQQAKLFELDLDEEPVAEAAPVDDEPELQPAGRSTPALPRQLTAAAGAAPFGARCLAGLADVGVHVVVAFAALAGARGLAVAPTQRGMPGFVLLLLVFSLFYTVVPLAFWGRTPGMAALGLAARAGDEHPLTFAEAFRRWLASLLTVLLLGLPSLLALVGSRRSLADRWSGSDLVAD